MRIKISEIKDVSFELEYPAKDGGEPIVVKYDPFTVVKSVEESLLSGTGSDTSRTIHAVKSALKADACPEVSDADAVQIWEKLLSYISELDVTKKLSGLAGRISSAAASSQAK